MRELTNNDLHFCVSRIPRDLRELMTKNPQLTIAGGFIRSTIAGEHPSDIDLFGPSKIFLEAVAKDIALSRKGRLHESKNAFTVLAPPRTPLQFIFRWVFLARESILLSFDFTISQAALWVDEEKKWRSLITDGFYPDLAAKRLVYTHPVREEDAGGSLLRVRKFLRKGYNIQAYSLAGVISRLVTKVRDIEDQSEGFLTKVLTGLLREVDPLIVVDGVDFIDEHEISMDESGNQNDNA